MDDMNEFYKKVQMHFMKKNQECGELQYISSRTTSESNNHIDDMCKTIVNIFDTYKVPMKEKALIDNKQCVQSYIYLLLNTKFKNQERLAEDIIIGHLVDMFPPISPYLFIEILWNLEYDKILIESLLYMPLDLCTEIVEILKKCIEELSFRRSIDNICQLILIIYTKFIRLKETGLQSTTPEKSIEHFLIAFEELLLSLTDSRFIDRTGVSNLKKCERYGIVLKRLISTVKTCLEYKTKGISISYDVAKLYNVTFGREVFIKCEDALMENSVAMLDQKLMDLLLNKIKEVDCNTYLSWAEVDDEVNNMISLQRSIGNECYYFIEFLQNNEQLSQSAHLIECLQHLSSKPDTKQSSFVLSLQELCTEISDDKKELMQELLCRYKEWDHSIIDFVYKNRSLLNKKDFLNLLQYLTFILMQTNEDDFKEHCYNIVTKMVLLKSVPDIYEIVIAYLTKHDGKSYLESLHTEETFNEFIARNPNLQIPTNLKILLLFLLKNLELVLTILTKITIGNIHYKNIMISTTDMLLVSPFMQIREDNDKIFLASILKNICLQDVEWNGKKFMDFIQMAVDKSIIGVNDLVNDVFIPYLDGNSSNISNINSVLNNIRMLQDRCTKDTNVKGLVIALAKKMSFFRKNTSISKYVSSETIGQITRILEYFLQIKRHRITACTRKEIINVIESITAPIDKLYFASLWHLTQKGVSVVDIIEDYERHYFTVLNKLKEDPKVSEKLQNYLSNFRLQREDFLRHLITQLTDEEYHKIGSDLTVMYWFAFGWNNEIEAFYHLLRLTIEICCLTLEYPSIGGNTLFAFLLKSFLRFCKTFLLLERMKNQETVYRYLIENINEFNESIRHSPYAQLFATCLTSLNNNRQPDITSRLQNALNILYHFCDQCLELNCEYSEEIPKIPHSPKISKFYITHEIISTFIKVQITEAYECVRRLNELFVSD
ncbi:uncharacterized protein LOC143183168 [Calliopsis andreniformis]|uniref:uncharacterized protein LOC143183168 n=1 Tax=Calliopsis andreniformis TaxID=337506 RepID=UPI003FCC55C8